MGYTKVLFVSLTTGAVIMLAVSAWQLWHGGEREVFTRSARLALIVLVQAISTDTSVWRASRQTDRS